MQKIYAIEAKIKLFNRRNRPSSRKSSNKKSKKVRNNK